MEAAIFEDCMNIIEKFTEDDDPHFATFCVQWKNMMFMHVYSAQTSTIEIMQTTKAILHLAKRIVCAKDDIGKVVAQMRDNRQQLLRRIGGMYLMYAIYFKQPTKQYIKIPVCLETWQEISSFIKNLPTESSAMNEVRYTFYRLYQSDAFRFTALDFEVGLEDIVDYDKIYDIHRGREKAEVVRIKLKLKLQAMSETEKVLPEMVELEDRYNNIKRSLSSFQKSAMQSALPPTNIFHDIQDVIRSIHDILDEKTGEDKASTATKPKESNINETRKELKRKAAAVVDYSSDEDESNDDGDDASLQGTEKKREGKTSSRTMIAQELPEHIMVDLENTLSEDDEDGDEENMQESESEEEENTQENESEEEDDQQNDSENDVECKMSLSPESILPIEN